MKIYLSLGRQTVDRFHLFIKEKQNLGFPFLKDFQVQKSNEEVENHVLRFASFYVEIINESPKNF